MTGSVPGMRIPWSLTPSKLINTTSAAVEDLLRRRIESGSNPTVTDGEVTAV
jgi:hypothetical protein